MEDVAKVRRLEKERCPLFDVPFLGHGCPEQENRESFGVSEAR